MVVESAVFCDFLYFFVVRYAKMEQKLSEVRNIYVDY